MSSAYAPVAIAGATGFIGQALMHALGPQTPIIALTRRHTVSHRPSSDAALNPELCPELWQWRTCNLFNLLDTEKALTGARTAFYLVHSMSPRETLAQGNFLDMDLICADNFARAAQRVGIEHIIYLSGIIPASTDLSPHLQSRLEVEKTLQAHGCTVTTLRAGLIIGAGGSSYRMMMRLVRRLPIMLTPRWTRSKTQPIALEDVIALLRFALEHPELANQAYDVACPDVLSYGEMLQAVAALSGKRLTIWSLPIDTVNLSLLWVSLITQTPLQLVRPLVQSLKHSMVAQDGLKLQKLANQQALSFREAVRRALNSTPIRLFQDAQTVAQRRRQRTVLSVQRLWLPGGKNALWVAQEYARWLPQALWPLLRVDIHQGDVYRFCLPFGQKALLELRFAPHRSNATRQLFYISGGVLSRHSHDHELGRFEFRTVLNNRYVLAAVHHFVPRLPWYLYKITQAVVHLWVMRAFGRHLKHLASHTTPPPQLVG